MCLVHQNKKTEKIYKKMQLQTMKKTYASVEGVVRNGTKMEMIGGLFAIYVAKLIIYNTVVYSMKHHNNGQFSLIKLNLSLKNAN